mmetsp:Transcript_9794/g.25279  ORF Transcript_9794/g.25279 Transcript_9794/m.25279 type:complete len:329 (-) Transcript_9794:423-1409(-)
MLGVESAARCMQRAITLRTRTVEILRAVPMVPLAHTKAARKRAAVERYSEAEFNNPRSVRPAAAARSVWGKKLFSVHIVKDVRGEGAHREWLIGWDGEDEEGYPWEDSWEPTKNVGATLRAAFLADQKAAVKRLISIDSRPLDFIVQRSIWEKIFAQPVATFGHEIRVPLPALTLGSLAAHYFETMSNEYALTVGENAYTRELRLREPSQIGSFCDFSQFSEKASKSLLFRGRRCGNVDMIIVGDITITYTNEHPVAGCVNAEATVHTAWINGATGNIIGPHLTKGYLKKTDNMDKLIDYARSIVPEGHPLVAKGWCSLPANQYEVEP